MRQQFFDNARQLVVKIGSRVLGDKPGVIRSLADDFAFLKSEKKRVLLVSSGAISTGMKVMGLKKRPTEIARLQALAAIGQPELMQAYHKAFAKHRLKLAQMLVTWEDFADRKRYTNMQHTMDALMRDGVVPIINENDTVATQEIEFGDNDQLSSLVAVMCKADLLVLLTDANGFYADYAKGASTRLGVIHDLNDKVFAAVRDKKNAHSKGGMLSKLKAVEKSINKGTPCLLADGRECHILKKLFEGKDRGTLFLPKGVKEDSGIEA